MPQPWETAVLVQLDKQFAALNYADRKDMQLMSPIRAVWFDVGEVLINETREYGTWADWLGIPRHTFSAVFGAVIARGKDYREVFRYFRPDFDLNAARQTRLDEGLGEYLNGNDPSSTTTFAPPPKPVYAPSLSGAARGATSPTSAALQTSKSTRSPSCPPRSRRCQPADESLSITKDGHLRHPLRSRSPQLLVVL